MKAWTTAEATAVVTAIDNGTDWKKFQCPEVKDIGYQSFNDSYGQAYFEQVDSWYQKYRYTDIRKKPFSQVLMFGDAIWKIHSLSQDTDLHSGRL